MKRSCELCGDRYAMRGDLRHMHELEPGQRFTFPDSGRSGVHLRSTPARSYVTYGDRERAVQFSTRDGEPVAFLATASAEEACTPFADVIPGELP